MVLNCHFRDIGFFFQNSNFPQKIFFWHPNTLIIMKQFDIGILNTSKLQKWAQKSAENIIFYDGICALCNFWVRFVLWADTSEEFHFCALQSEGARKMLPSSVSDPSNLRTIILKAEGQTFKKSDAVLKIFQKLGLPWSLMSIFFLVPRPVRDLVYVLVAKYRYRMWGRYDQCHTTRGSSIPLYRLN